MIAVTFWEGWVLAHPAPVLIAVACAGTLAVLVILMRAEDRRDDRDAGIPQNPRRGARSRARGARRQVTVSACRRARAARAWAMSWFWWLDSPAGPRPWQAARERLALCIHGITIDVTGRDGNRPGTPSTAANGGQQCATAHATVIEGTEREHDPAGDLAGSYEPTEAEEAYMREHHPAAMLIVGPPERPETPANTCEHPGTVPICSCGWPAESPEPARLAAGAERAAAAPRYAPEAAALSPWEHKTQWFSLDAIDADIRARAAAGGDA